MILQHYSPTHQLAYTGRKEILANQRFYQTIHCLDLQHTQLTTQPHLQPAILGFCSEEGIIRNHGRPGAKFGPEAFRKAFANLPAHGIAHLIDVGDITVTDDLELGQKALGSVVSELVKHHYLPIVIGGGHELAWGQYQGIHQSPLRKKLGIINFDAHFDLRPLAKPNYGTSGTPFTQIAQQRELDKLGFHYLCVGIQPTANTPELFEQARILGAEYISASQLTENDVSHSLSIINHSIQQCDSIYLSICMDVFSASLASGVSAPQSLGILPERALPLIQHIMQSGKTISLAVAELSPPYDQNSLTARLAAELVAHCLYTQRV